jgi:hypothetical protein
VAEASISTAGGGANGATALRPASSPLSEAPPSAAASRVLLRFGGLHSFLPPATRPVKAAALALTFDNARGSPAPGEVWFVDKAWEAGGALGWLKRT